MRYLSAQVTNSLLRFPEGTQQALGKDQVTQGSVLHGKFSGGSSDIAWLACGPHLNIVNSVTGEQLSAYHFRGEHKEPPTIGVVKEFSWKERSGLLIAVEEAERSVLCLYDLGASSVVKEVILPGRVVAVEPLSNDGGPSVHTQHLHQSLRWLFGIAAVATDIGHLFLVDLSMDGFSWNQGEIEVLDVNVVASFAEDIPARREIATMGGRHLCFLLPNPSGTPISSLCYISRINQLVVGFSDGCLSLWNMKTLKEEHRCRLGAGRIPVQAIAFQEPEKDPSNCCYLWAVKSTQESDGDVLRLHLLQLTFGSRKRLASGQVMYEGLECCRERFSLDLASGILPWRRQNSHIKLLSCQTIEVFSDSVDQEDKANEVPSPYISVSMFCWQVTTSGVEKPSAYLGVFDLNRWCDVQMPVSIRPEKFLLDCPYFAVWRLDSITNMVSPDPILDILVHEPSLTWGALYLPPDQKLNASGYNFDGVCLLSSGVVHLTCNGFQKEEEQLDAILSAAVQTGSLELLSGCIKRWTSEKQANSMENLQFIFDCAWNKVLYAKDDFDQMCVPLFNGSSNIADPSTLQSLQHCQCLLSNLSRVFNCFQSQELTGKGFADLRMKQVLANHISVYAKVVVWFCQAGLLPEGLGGTKQLSTPFYNYPLLEAGYSAQRQKLEHLSRGECCSEGLMIDGIVENMRDEVATLWQREEGGTGQYPPPSLHALLDLYLLDNIEETYKHAITIYLLRDIFMCWPHKIEKTITSFASTFAVPQGLVKLTEAFWLLDHKDYEKSLALLCHPETMKTAPGVKSRIIQAFLRGGEHKKALKYIQNDARKLSLEHRGKILPKVQRKLAAERAKPYRLPS